MIKFYDTNALLSLQDEIFNEFFVVSSISFVELESIKKSAHKSNEVKEQARSISRKLDEHYGRYLVHDTPSINDCYGDNDGAIVESACSYKKVSGLTNDDFVFVSDDINCKHLARINGLNVISVHNEKIDVYKGYKTFTGTSSEINDYIDAQSKDNWNINEYLVIENTETESGFEMRFDGESFVPLKLPSSRYIKAKNALQRCALDILNNPAITVAAIMGGYGSGKTYLSMRMAIYAIEEKGWQSKILGIREAIGEGKQIGYLPGTKEDKLMNFFTPLEQQLEGGEFELSSLKQRGVLTMNCPYYLKGTTYNDTVILVDEAEDLDEKQIRLVGTRIGDGSKIIFSGDYKQSVVDSSKKNGLVKMCNELKGNANFACIYLGEDVRSTTSKMFADLFTK